MSSRMPINVDVSKALSKTLSKYLRHNVNVRFIGIDGYVNLHDVHNALPSIKQLPIDDLKNIIEQDSKQRFSMILRDDQYFIRANQGHSARLLVKLDPTLIFTLIDTALPEEPMHGTYLDVFNIIKTNGLSRMGRTHIHLATAIDAKSGARKKCNVRIYINMAQAMVDGIQFYMSANGVVLTNGVDGILAPKYFSRFDIL